MSYESDTDKPKCTANHNGYVPAVPASGELHLCTKHLNRHLQNIRTWAYVEENQIKCPDHPERPVHMTRWFGDVRVYCSKPLDEGHYVPPKGRGVFQ